MKMPVDTENPNRPSSIQKYRAQD